MIYELCKKLKDAGFPQDIDSSDVEFFRKQGEDVPTKDPTLSELIEACGEGQRTLEEEAVGEWVAKKHYGFDKPPEIGYGKTPSEAVANLWLKLKVVIS